MTQRLHTDRVLVVEGKYDAARLARLTDAMILLTDGFAIFSDKKRQRLLKELARQVEAMGQAHGLVWWNLF